jgi:hypothetical protein
MTTGKNSSTKKNSKLTKKAKLKRIRTAVKSASDRNSQEIFPASENGKFPGSSTANANPAEIVETFEAQIVDMPRDVMHAEIANEINEAMQSYLRIVSGESSVRDRVMVHEALNGSLYTHACRPRGWRMQVVYFDTDPLAEAQFGRVFRKLMGD